MARKPPTSDALQILDRRYPPSVRDRTARAGFRDSLEVAELVHDLRVRSGLSQRELATRIGTTASVICRLEDADYDKHSMAMLRRIAAALGQRIEMRFVPAERELKRA